MRDFTLLLYKKLLLALSKAEYEFMTFAEFIQSPIAGNLSSVVRPLTSLHLKSGKTVILRHDVDKKPLRSLRTAELENELGIKGTYYFRVKKDKLPEEVIERVAKMGHEIGYHYDDLHDANGDVNEALALFQKNLVALRTLSPVKTACMHGSPMSRFDNRDMWKERNYREFGIIGEPYFDIDFNEVMYLTDTGRRWDGGRVSIRDRVSGYGEDRGQRTEDRFDMEKGSRGGVADPPVPGYESEDRGQRTEDRRQKTEDRFDMEKGCRGAVCDPPVPGYESEDRGQKAEDRFDMEKGSRGAVADPPVLGHEEVVKRQEYVVSSEKLVVSSKNAGAFKLLKLHSTMDIINAARNDQLPNKIMLTVHPQRWTDNHCFWLKELLWQKFKNLIKYYKLTRLEKQKKR